MEDVKKVSLIENGNRELVNFGPKMKDIFYWIKKYILQGTKNGFYRIQFPRGVGMGEI